MIIYPGKATVNLADLTTAYHRVYDQSHADWVPSDWYKLDPSADVDYGT